MSNTSWQTKKKSNHKVYRRISVDINKNLVAEWEDRLNADGIGKAEFIRQAIKKYLNKD